MDTLEEINKILDTDYESLEDIPMRDLIIVEIILLTTWLDVKTKEVYGD